MDITQEELNELAGIVAQILSRTSQGVGDIEVTTSLNGVVSLPALYKDGDIIKVVEAPLSLLKIGIQVTDTYIQWRLGQDPWVNVIALKSLEGKPFTYDMFTPAQLEGLKLHFSDLTTADVEALKLKFSDLTPDEIKLLQKPGTDIGEKIKEDMKEISDDWTDTLRPEIVNATKDAKDAAENVKDGVDGKTPQLSPGTVNKTPPGGNPSITMEQDGVDENDNPKIKINFTFPTGDTGAVPVLSSIEVNTIPYGQAGTGDLVPDGKTTEGVPKYKMILQLPAGKDGEGVGNVIIEETGGMSTKTYGISPKQDGSNEYVLVAIPTKTSELENDKEFQSEGQVNTKISAHNTSNSAHQDIRTLISAALTALRVHEGTGIRVTVEENGDITLDAEINNEIFVPVTELPDTGEGNKIYLLPKSDPEAGDHMDEYVWVGISDTHPNGYELFGSVKVDLSGYLTAIQSDARYASKEEVKSKHKTVTLLPSNWQLFEDFYRASVTDADLVTGVAVLAYTDSVADLRPTLQFAEGVMYVCADAAQTANVVLNYDIVSKGTVSAGLVLAKEADELTAAQRTLLSFFEGSKTVTSLASLTLTKQIIFAAISANQSISVSSRVVDGHPTHIFVRNTGTTARTITIPTTGSYVSMSGASKTLPASGYLEISIAYDSTISKYRIVVLEAE